MKYRKVIFVFLLLLLINLMCLFIFAQGVGYIQIKCEPGATVFLDNNFVGSTSSELGGLILQDVLVGSHVIKIAKEGFEPQSVKIDLKVNEIYVYEVKEFIPQLDVIQEGEADTDTIKQRVGSLLIETIPIDCIIEIPKLNINKEHYGNKTKKTWEISKVPIGSYRLNFIALGKKIEYNLKIEEGIQKHLLVNILNNEVKEILPICVTFSIEAGNGTIEARADGNLINSGDFVKEGAEVVFKVIPDIDQIVRDWALNEEKGFTLVDGRFIIESLQEAIDFKVNFEDKPPQIRGKGPAGGWIFYDKGKYTNGWRYLEAAPVSTEWNDTLWSISLYYIKGIETGIGTGKSNTKKIVTWNNRHSVSPKDKDYLPSKKSIAAQICDDLVYGGYDDWFLPSIDELHLMYTNLAKSGIGGFAKYYYWSSSQKDFDSAWIYGFPGVGSGQRSGPKDDCYVNVRAVRSF